MFPDAHSISAAPNSVSYRVSAQQISELVNQQASHRCLLHKSMSCEWPLTHEKNELEKSTPALRFPGLKSSLPVRGQIMVGPHIDIDCFIFRRPCFGRSLKPDSRMIVPPMAQESINKQVSFFL